MTKMAIMGVIRLISYQERELQDERRDGYRDTPLSSPACDFNLHRYGGVIDIHDDLL